jgi:hypothetical protein
MRLDEKKMLKQSYNKMKEIENKTNYSTLLEEWFNKIAEELPEGKKKINNQVFFENFEKQVSFSKGYTENESFGTGNYADKYFGSNLEIIVENKKGYEFKDIDGKEYNKITLHVNTGSSNAFFKYGEGNRIYLGHVYLYDEITNTKKIISYTGKTHSKPNIVENFNAKGFLVFKVSYDNYYIYEDGHSEKIKDNTVNSNTILEKLIKNIENKIYGKNVISFKIQKWKNYKFYQAKPQNLKDSYKDNKSSEDTYTENTSTNKNYYNKYNNDNKKTKKKDAEKVYITELAKVDLYQMLGVKENATKKEIKGAYLKLSKKVHPDLNEEPIAEQMFKALNNAYKTLYNEDSRKKYDKEKNIKNTKKNKSNNNQKSSSNDSEMER